MLNRLSVPFTLLLIFAVQTFGQTVPAGWVKLASDVGRFSVLIPGTELPAEKAETTTIAKVPEAAPYTSHLFVQRTDKGVFLIGWVDYAPNFRPNVQGELAANRDNFVKGLEAKVTSEKPIKLGDIPGIEFTAESKSLVIQSRVYMIGSRPYMLVAGTFTGMNDAANIERFFDSFHIQAAQ